MCKHNVWPEGREMLAQPTQKIKSKQRISVYIFELVIMQKLIEYIPITHQYSF